MPLPNIDHAKNMEKLRNITGRSEDFASSADSNNVQFSKPKIGVKGRVSSVSNSAQGLNNKSGIGSKPDLRSTFEGGSRSALS